MRVELCVECAQNAPAALFECVADACARAEGLDTKVQVALTLVDDAAIRTINREHRNMDGATDVLSFPTVAYAKGKTARDCPKRLRRELDPDTGHVMLGDIFLSCERALEQAAAYGHTPAREMGYLFAHGILHLLGYDHETEDDRARMRRMEERVMAMAGLPRSDDHALIESAREAMRQAYVPYSHFRVGACLRTADGRVFTGCNIENASFGLTNCAERTAVFKAVSEGATALDAIAIAAEGAMPYPCGACRQVLREFAPASLRVLIVCDDAVEETTLEALLPHSFGPESLQK